MPTGCVSALPWKPQALGPCHVLPTGARRFDSTDASSERKPNRSETRSLKAGGCTQQEHHRASANTAPSGETCARHCGAGKAASSPLLHLRQHLPRCHRLLSDGRALQEKTYLPAKAPTQEGWVAQETVSKRVPELPKALPPPQLPGLRTLRASPGPDSYAHETPGSSRHNCCQAGALRSWAGILLTDAHSPQTQSHQRNLLATIVDRSRTQLSHNPGPTLLSKRVLHAGSSPNTEHARVLGTPHLHPHN